MTGNAATTPRSVSDNIAPPTEINGEDLRRNNSMSEALYNMDRQRQVPNLSDDHAYNSEEYTTIAPSFAPEWRSTTPRQEVYEGETPMVRLNTANTGGKTITIYDTAYNVKPVTASEDSGKSMSSNYNMT